MLNTCNIQWHGINIPIPKGKNRGLERNGTKARLKSSRTNTKSCSSVSSAQNKLWQDVNSKGVGWASRCSTDGGCSPHGFSFSLALLILCSFPQMFHVPGFSNLLGSPLYFGLHFHSFMHCSFRDTLPDLPGLLKSEWKPSQLHNSGVLHAPKTSTV